MTSREYVEAHLIEDLAAGGSFLSVGRKLGISRERVRQLALDVGITGKLLRHSRHLKAQAERSTYRQKGSFWPRFWSRIIVRGASDCWLWSGGHQPNGYPHFRVDMKKGTTTGHRIALMWKLGRWPTKCALHRCDVRGCVNPGHVYEGTQQQNVADRQDRGREQWAQRLRGNIPETMRQEILRLRLDGLPYHRIAERLDVGIDTARRWGKARKWTDVTP